MTSKLEKTVDEKGVKTNGVRTDRIAVDSGEIGSSSLAPLTMGECFSALLNSSACKGSGVEGAH